MGPDLNVLRQPHVHKTDHCHHKKPSKFSTLIGIMEKISAVALGVFSLYTKWQLFVPFFFAGTVIGIYSHMKDKKSCAGHHGGSSCAQGLLEQLTGVKLPPVISLAANLAATVCHIDHHASVFVPITAVSLGNWIGKMAANYGTLAHKKITAHINKDTVASMV